MKYSYEFKLRIGDKMQLWVAPILMDKNIVNLNCL